MRAYIGRVAQDGLRVFVAEDMLPGGLLQDLVNTWTSRAETVVQAILSEDGAEEIHRALTAQRPDAACGILLNRAIELVPLRPLLREYVEPPHPDQSGRKSAPVRM